jgi:hypothetical protein
MTPRGLLLLAVLVVPVALWARWHGAPEAAGPFFHPRPDALEYAASAQAIAQTGRFYLQIGPYQVRPRYPPGWPLLLAAALRSGVAAADLWRVTGVFGAVLAWLLAITAASAVAILGGGAPHPRPLSHLPPTPPPGEGRQEEASESVASFLPSPGDREGGAGRGAGGEGAFLAGLLAGWIWALAPVAAGVGRTLLSDEPAALAAVAALAFTGVGWLAELEMPRRAALCAALGGLSLGLCAAMRPIAAVLLAPPLLIFLAAAIRRSGIRPLLPRIGAWALGAVVFPAAVMIILHRSELRPAEWSGYAFWLPERYGRLSDTFGLRYALRPDESFRLGEGGQPLSHLGIAARVLFGLPGLRAHHSLGLLWPVLGWLAAVPLLLAARRRAGIAAALLLWVLGHVVVFSLYFYPTSRFYLGPLALCTVLLASACGLGWNRPGLRPRLLAVAAAVLALALTVRGWAELQQEPPPERDERIGSRFARWRDRSDEERAGRTMPFDPVVAQALGLLTPGVVESVHTWGELPPTVHVRRLRALGVLPPEASESPKPPAR